MRYCVTLIVALSLFGGWGRREAMAAQEVPTAVASDLVEEALTHELHLPSAEPVASESAKASLLLLISVGAGVLIALGLLRADRPWEHSPWRYSTFAGDGGSFTAPSVEGFEGGVGRDERPPDARDGPSDTKRWGYTRPKEELKLPPHVLAMLQRDAHTSDVGDVLDGAESDEQRAQEEAGLDVLVPRWNPRTRS